MVNKLIDGVSFLYPSPHPASPSSRLTNSRRSSTRPSRRRTGRPPRNCCTRSPTPPTTSIDGVTQREGATHPGLPLGEAQAQELEEGPQSTPPITQALHLTDFLLKYGPTSLVNALKENLYEFRNFDNYTLVVDGVDRGESSTPSPIQSGSNRAPSWGCCRTTTTSVTSG